MGLTGDSVLVSVHRSLLHTFQIFAPFSNFHLGVFCSNFYEANVLVFFVASVIICSVFRMAFITLRFLRHSPIFNFVLICYYAEINFNVRLETKIPFLFLDGQPVVSIFE